MIRLRLHRWQPKQNRYKTQFFDLEADAMSFFDLVCGRGDAVKKFVDPAMRQTVARTQQIDRIVVTPQWDTDGVTDAAYASAVIIEVYMSPFVERNYPTTRLSAFVKGGHGPLANDLIAANSPADDLRRERINRTIGDARETGIRTCCTFHEMGGDRNDPCKFSAPVVGEFDPGI